MLSTNHERDRTKLFEVICTRGVISEGLIFEGCEGPGRHGHVSRSRVRCHGAIAMTNIEADPIMQDLFQLQFPEVVGGLNVMPFKLPVVPIVVDIAENKLGLVLCVKGIHRHIETEHILL